MKSLYVTSVERYSGKTAVCLALGRKLIADGYKVGFLKPLSLQAWRSSGRVADEDAAFVKEILGLKAQPWELSPIVVTPEFLVEHLKRDVDIDMMPAVEEAAVAAAQGNDILLMEGGASLREGYTVGLPTPVVAQKLGSSVLVIVKYREHVRLLDDALASRTRLGDVMAGVLINRVPAEAADFVQHLAIPYLEQHGIPVFGVIPEKRSLEAISVEELTKVLNATVLTKTTDPQALVETLTVGAMTADAALSRFRKQTNKAVITGGDRTDIQLAALETSTTCLILTGNLHPSPLIIRQAEEFGVSVLLVSANTMETIEAIERVLGKTRLGQTVKLKMFEDLLFSAIDLPRLYRAIGITASS